MKRLLLFILLSMLIACQTIKLSELSPLQEALQPKIEQLTQIKNRINVQGRALSTHEIAFVEKVEAVERDYAVLTATIAEKTEATRRQVERYREQLQALQTWADALLQASARLN